MALLLAKGGTRHAASVPGLWFNRWLASYKGSIKAQIREVCFLPSVTSAGCALADRRQTMKCAGVPERCNGDPRPHRRCVESKTMIASFSLERWCRAGGPITRVEARLMGSLIADVTADLKTMGVNDPQIKLEAFETIWGLQDRLPELLGEMMLPPKQHDELFDLGEGRQPFKEDLVFEGVAVFHPQHGAGRLARIDYDNPRGRPFTVEFDCGEVRP